MLRHVFVETAYTEVLSGIEHYCDVCFPPGIACVLLSYGPAVLKLCPLIKETVVYSLTVTPGDSMATAAYPTHSFYGVAVWQVDAWRAKSVTTQSQTNESLPEAIIKHNDLHKCKYASDGRHDTLWMYASYCIYVFILLFCNVLSVLL